MKSAFDLAMEKLGGSKSYSNEQKAALEDISKRFEAKRAELTLAAEERIKHARGDEGTIDSIRGELAHELAKLDEKEDAEKMSIRAE